MFCRKCGAKMPDGTLECTVCGAQMSVPVSTPVAAPAETENTYSFTAAPQTRNCPACGAPLDPSVKFCGSCGSQVEPAQPAVMPDYSGAVQPAAKAGGSKSKLLIIAAVAVVAVAVVLFLIFGGSGGPGGSPEDAVENFLDSTFSADVDGILSVVPEELAEEALDDMDPDEMEEYLQEMLDGIESFGVRYSYEILETDDVSKSELKELKEHYEDEYDIEVTDAQVVEVELNVESDFGDQSESMEFTVIEIGGDWYIEVESMGSIF